MCKVGSHFIGICEFETISLIVIVVLTIAIVLIDELGKDN